MKRRLMTTMSASLLVSVAVNVSAEVAPLSLETLAATRFLQEFLRLDH